MDSTSPKTCLDLFRIFITIRQSILADANPLLPKAVDANHGSNIHFTIQNPKEKS